MTAAVVPSPGMTTEFRVLGPVEAVIDGRPARLSPRQRSVLAVLLLHAGQVVPTNRLIDAVWGDHPPDTAANVLQGYVSQLRKALGKTAVETRDPGYLLRVDPGALDLHRFERLATDGARALEDGRPEEAAQLLREALALWRGEALADVADGDVLRPAAARLDELRLAALERRIDADLAGGHHGETIGELEELTAAHPLRERLRVLQMLALYRCGRQADALEVYRTTRARLVDELGLDPGAALQDLEQAILRHDGSLDLAASAMAAGTGPAAHTILVAALEPGSLDALVTLAEPLLRDGHRDLVLSTTVADARGLVDASASLRAHRERLLAEGLAARAAAFTSLTPGADLARIAREQDAELLLVDAPARLLEDARLLGLLDDAQCDVAVLVGGEALPGPVLVPFSGRRARLGGGRARSLARPQQSCSARSGGFDSRRRRPRREPTSGKRLPRRAADTGRARGSAARGAVAAGARRGGGAMPASS